MANKRSIEMTEAFTEEGIKKLRVKQLLRFDYEGSIVEYIITKVKDNRVWAKETKTYLPEEIKVVDNRK